MIKHHIFVHIRILIEFKYISNTKFQSNHCPIENFPLKQKDTLQITGYARDLIREYPEVTLKKYVIYCIGNHGFQIYDLDST